jgi:hypothetical protein
MSNKLIDLTGQKFGRLTAVKFDNSIKRKHFWLFKCDCGNFKVINKFSATKGLTKSCGCILKDNPSAKKHGMKNTSFYVKFGLILSRCNNEHNNRYKNYGFRGIKCLWKTFEEFKDDMYESYLKHVEEFGEKNTTIDRIDNDGNYCKENCKWSTKKEQYKNRTDSHLITYNNITMCLSDWAREVDIPIYTLFSRINLYKWSIEKALTTPVKI